MRSQSNSFLNESAGEGKWRVDTNTPEKVLTVEAAVPSGSITTSVKAAGFQIEQLEVK